jgi:hypothetical protein
VERAAFLIEATGDRVECLVNPETIVVRREAGIRRRRLVGELIGQSAWSDDALVCGAGGLTELQLDLLFDTSLVPPPAQCDDVQNLTRPFYDMAEHAHDTSGHYQPQFVNVIWGKAFDVRCVVSALAERFECFSATGAPQRSWLRMRLIRVSNGPREANGGDARDTTRGTPALLRDEAGGIGGIGGTASSFAALSDDSGSLDTFLRDSFADTENGS